MVKSMHPYKSLLSHLSVEGWIFFFELLWRKFRDAFLRDMVVFFMWKSYQYPSIFHQEEGGKEVIVGPLFNLKPWRKS